MRMLPQQIEGAQALARILRVGSDAQSLDCQFQEGGGEWSYEGKTFFVCAFGIHAESTRGIDVAIMNWVKKIYRRTPDWYARPSFLNH